MNNKKTDRTISKNLKNSPSSFSLKLKREELIRLNEAKEILKAEKGKYTLAEELIRLEKAKELLFPLKEKYKLTFDELKELIEEKAVTEEILFPISIFNSKLTVLESTVKYLKEEKELSLRKISSLINRDERNIWHIFDSANKKYSDKFNIKDSKLWIPVSIFSDSKLSAQESLVVYLKDKQNLSYHEIAVLLERNDRTIWTVYSRARKKNAK